MPNYVYFIHHKWTASGVWSSPEKAVTSEFEVNEKTGLSEGGPLKGKTVEELIEALKPGGNTYGYRLEEVELDKGDWFVDGL